jgi:hypothetical protein
MAYDGKQTAEERCGILCEALQRYMDEERRAPITMTDATEAIWGTSGRGNPNAVLKIEAMATLGYVEITCIGKRRREVVLTDKGLHAADDYRKALDEYRSRLETAAK